MRLNIGVWRLLLLGAIFFGCAQLSYGQKFERNYGGDSLEFSNFIRQTHDGGFVMSGVTNSFGNSRQIYLLRIDQYGKKLWENNYGGASEDIGHAVYEINDGGFLVLGSRDTGIFKKAILIKVDAFGGFVWEKSLDFIGPERDFLNMTKMEDGLVIIGTNLIDTTDSQIILVKVDFEGNKIWEKQYGGPNSYNFGSDVEALPDKSLIITGISRVDGSNNVSLFLSKIDPNGDYVWSRFYNSFDVGIVRDVKMTPDGGFLIAGQSRPGQNVKAFILKTESSGIELWHKLYAGIGKASGYYAEALSDGGYMVGGRTYNPDDESQIFMIKTDPAGNQVWEKEYGGDLLDEGLSFISLPDNGFIISGSTNTFSRGVKDVYVLRMDANGVTYTNKIFGKVFVDNDGNCSHTPSVERNLKGWIVEAKGANGTFYAETNDVGFYQMLVDSGTYQVRVLMDKHPSWNINCDNNRTINFPGKYADTSFIFGITPLNACNEMWVDVGVPKLKRCFPSNYTVNYCNNSSHSTSNVRVEVALDAYLEYLGSSIPFSSQNGNLYSFDIGDVASLACGSFNIQVLVKCDSTLTGQSHCVSAHIFPDDVCLPSFYDGPNLEVNATCDGDSVYFKVKNIGQRRLNTPKPAIIIEDEVIGRSFNIQLEANEEIIIPVKANTGKTYRLEVTEDGELPSLLGDSVASFVYEGCVEDRTQGFNTGYVTIFSQDDEVDFISIDCRESVSALDPNEKIALPEGYDEQHLIAKGTYIDYTIHFQNIGTDTAYHVEVIDSLSDKLDIKSFVMGTSSDDLVFELHDDGVLKVIFDSIFLPDSNTNELASNGFFKFRIKVKEDVAIGEVVYNQADVYFDYEYPVRTNQTFHTIGENFVRIGSFVPRNNVSAKVLVFPNPTLDKSWVKIEDYSGQITAAHLYDLSGKAIRTYPISGNSFVIEKSDLAVGTYVLQLLEGDDIVGTAKLIIQ